MGCICSKKQKSPSNYIRVVHMNGYVEDFDYSLTAGEATGKPHQQFLCTQAQLMSGSLKPLKPDTRLEPNHVYFLLSYSTFQSESSPLDVAIMAKRLIKLANTNCPQAKPPSSACGTSPGSESPIRSPSPLGDTSSTVEFGKLGSGKGPGSWKPVLDTIRERSFNRGSESDLKEMQSDIII